jgi:DNA-binding MarR family transcriptional regulator
MTRAASWYDTWSTPALLRHARDVYRSAIREALIEAGYDDMPRDGAYVVGGVAHAGAPLGELIRHLGVSKQAGGQLVDTLVARGYLDRSVDTEDRRRLIITLTERGRAAAAVVRSTVEEVDAQLVQKVGAEAFANTLATLASLIGGDAGMHTPGQNAGMVT